MMRRTRGQLNASHPKVAEYNRVWGLWGPSHQASHPVGAQEKDLCAPHPTLHHPSLPLPPSHPPAAVRGAISRCGRAPLAPTTPLPHSTTCSTHSPCDDPSAGCCPRSAPPSMLVTAAADPPSSSTARHLRHPSPSDPPSSPDPQYSSRSSSQACPSSSNSLSSSSSPIYPALPIYPA